MIFSGLVYSGKMVKEDSGSIPTLPEWQALRKSHLKVNQELNELKMKANELEKLFAEHKLRGGSGEQSSSSAPLPKKSTVTQPLTSSSNMSKLSVTPRVKVLVNQDHSDAKTQNFSEIGLSDYAKGKFYQSYMQKRDAKLSKEWGSKKEEKEAKMKAMRDSFEQSAAEMKAKFSGSIKRDAERSRSLNSRSTMKMEENKDEEYLSFGNGVCKSPQVKKPPNKNLSSSIPRSSAAPVPKSSTNTSNSSSGRRTMQPETPLAHSVPNLSELRKENPKPNSGISKTTTRPPTKIHARSKSCIEDIVVVKEERKPRPSQSQSKSTVVPTELGVVLTPSKLDKSDKSSKNVESKPFRGKGSCVGPGAGAVIANMKGSVESKTMNNEVESDELASGPKELPDMSENDKEEESETATTEDHVNVDNVKPRLSHEPAKSVGSGSDGDTSRSSSRVEKTSSVAELPSTFHPVGLVQHSPVQSPLSWNSSVQHAFSYTNETSDIDASPVGSIASWNSLPLTQAEAGASRMRKKWGSTQKPNLVSNSSHGHSRKDVTRGFKRLLHIGQKSDGSDTLGNWISATSSKGNNYTRGRPTDDSFNEMQGLRSSIPSPPVKFKLRDHHLSGSSIKGPRSLFSLSSFRSK